MSVLEKQAEGLTDTIKSIWKDTEKYQPAMYGALGGAAFAGLGTMGARAGENPRQRALRVLRNALGGGVLGGTALQLMVPGSKNFVEGMGLNEDKEMKPGFFRSNLARLGYSGTAMLGGNKLQGRRQLKNLEKLLPTQGLGTITYQLAGKDLPSTHVAGSPAPIKAINFPTVASGLNSTLGGQTERALEVDKKLRTLRKATDPKTFENLMIAIKNQGTNNKGLFSVDLPDFLRSQYAKGTNLNLRRIDRTFNILGSSASTRLGRNIGRITSPAALGASFMLPQIYDGVRGDKPEDTHHGALDYLLSPGTKPTKPEEPGWLSNALIKGW